MCRQYAIVLSLHCPRYHIMRTSSPRKSNPCRSLMQHDAKSRDQITTQTNQKKTPPKIRKEGKRKYRHLLPGIEQIETRGKITSDFQSVWTTPNDQCAIPKTCLSSNRPPRGGAFFSRASQYIIVPENQGKRTKILRYVVEILKQ